MKKRIQTLLAVSLALSVVSTSVAAGPTFAVASIKLNRNPQPEGDTQITPGRFHGTSLALQWLILTAYKVRSGNLTGALPNWTISERYDIDATTGDASGDQAVLLALKNLLAERFQLKLHRESRDEPVYFLTVGKTGIKMPARTCVPKKQDLPNECYSSRSDGAVQTLDWRGVRLSAPDGVAYRALGWALSGPLRRPVIDHTGLSGTFDVHLRWARDNDAGGALPDAPSLPDALEQQLGLKLVPGRGPVDYVVVDRVERPAEN